MTEPLTAGKIQHWFLHVDLDAFFASVEQLDHPEYRGKPVIVGGKPEDRRSVVSTASYEARKFGVHSAMPTFQAYKLCPEGIFVHGRMERYAELSYQIMNIFKDFSPDVEQMSIDEAFIDLTGTEKLFGRPEETAMKIKQLVKEKTGLTVSMGLAQTKYIAKIASGYKKPDGFHFVKPGEESAFMLSVPLSKVWGIGKKSLENLNRNGLYTTREIFEREYDLLEFQFGKNTASFLYDVMHTGGKDVFKSGDPKSHSISAETTFPIDITDSYTAETALLELAHGVLFRLLRENGYSRTVMVKIRYNDFRTVSIQQTVDYDVLTLDNFFEIAKALFNKKYELGSGIRLLGIGLENISNNEKPVQQQLFDDGNSKKQAVEKAILKLEKKHPEIKIQKARTIKNLVVAGFFLLSALFAKTSGGKLHAQAIPYDFSNIFINNNPDSLYDWEINDKNHVDFYLKGWWQGIFETSFLWSFQDEDQREGTETEDAFTASAPIFKQNVDLTALIGLNKTWFFEARFADEFKKNTYAVFYKGKGYLQYARLSNRNIEMLNNYSADYFGYGLKGGENQSPGLILHFADFLDNRWSGDFLFRYDMTKTRTATFYGMNSATDMLISPKDFARGKRFVLPADAAVSLAAIKDIFLETPGGSYSDKNHRKYKKLSSSDYLILQSQCQIIFSDNINSGKTDGKIPQILVTFYSSGEPAFIAEKTGSYDDSASFAGKIQEYFTSQNDYGYKLNDFDTAARAAAPWQTIVEGENALILQSASGFSPYAFGNYYELGVTKDADVKLIYSKTEYEAENYAVEITDDSYSAVREDFFNESRSYAQIISTLQTGKSFQEPEVRFPLAATNPEIYLNISGEDELQILMRSYSRVSDFRIGTNAAGGSVLLYKNGILDSGAKYDSETGIVTPGSSVSTSDKIYIVWQEDNSNFENGSLSAGAGFIYNFTPQLKVDWTLTATWPVSVNNKYSTAGNMRNGFAAFATGIEWNKENIKLSEKTSFSVNTQNAAENLLVCEQNDFLSRTFYLTSAAGFITKAEPYVFAAGTGASGTQLLAENNGTILKHGGETEKGISGYKIPLQWDFSGIGNDGWAAVDIKLNAGNLLKNSAELELAVKTELTGTQTDLENTYDVFLQLGIKAESDFSGEDAQAVSAWKISGPEDSAVITGIDFSKNEWQTIRIRLSDTDRAKLSSAYDARLIVINKDPLAASALLKGKIYAGPYKPVVQPLHTVQDSSIQVTTSTERTLSSPSSQKLEKNSNYSSAIKWNILNPASITADKTKITAVSYFEPADFSTYGKIHFDFACIKESTSAAAIPASDEEMIFILDNSALSASSEGKTGVKLTLKNASQLYSENLRWNSLEIDIDKKIVCINGTELQKADYDLYISSKNIPSRMKIVFDTNTDGNLIESGNFYIDNLYYSDSALYATRQNNISLFIKKEEILPAVKNASFSVESTQTGSTLLKDENSSDNNQGSISASAEGKITVAGINLRNNAAIASSSVSSDKNILKNAGHGIETETEIFNFLSFEENYNFDHDDESLKKLNWVKLNFDCLNIPLSVHAKTQARSEFSTQAQNVLFEYNFSPWILNINQQAEFSQKLNTRKTSSQTFNTNNYFAGWKDISEFEFSAGSEQAFYRTEKYSAYLEAALPAAALRPKLSGNMTSAYSTASQTIFTDNTDYTLSVPFQLGSNSFYFSASKAAGGRENLVHKNSDYADDSRMLFTNQGFRTYLYKTAPFYDLFQTDISDMMKNDSRTSTENLSYSTKYESNWRRRLFNTRNDLLVPSAVTFTVERDLNCSIKNNDTYQFRTTVMHNAINSFGSQSFKPVFRWYEQDEILNLITGTVRMPSDRRENTVYSVSDFLQVLFFVNSDNTLRTAADISFETDLNWALQTSLIWQRKGNSALIVEIAKFLSKRAREMDFFITRKETLNYKISKKDEVYKQTYTLAHDIEAKFLQHFSLTTEIAGDFNYVSNANNTLELKLTIGGKAEF